MKPATKRATKPRPQTPRRGADDERLCWMRKIKRLLAQSPRFTERTAVLEELVDWGWSRHERAKEKAGGL